MKARALSADEMRSTCDKMDKSTKAASAAFTKAKTELEKAGKGLNEKYEKELTEYSASEAKRFNMDMGRMENRIARCQQIAKRFRGQGAFKEVEVLEKLKAQALKVVRYNQGVKELSAEELFDVVAKGGKIKQKEWLDFFSTADTEVKSCIVKAGEKEEEKDAEMEEKKEEEAEEKKEEDAAEEKKAEEEKTEGTEEKAEGEDAEKKEEEEKKAPVVVKKLVPKKKEEAVEKTEKIELSQDELKKVFEYVDEDADGFLSKERFLMLAKRYMKVVKETAMTSQMTVAGSKALRKLEIKEIVEVLKPPMREGAMTVSRILCKTQKDDLEGWVSVAGNKGTVFLEDVAFVFKVVKPVALTDSFETTDGDNMLSVGTALEVREMPRKDEESGVTRMQGRVILTEKKSGWVTTQSKDGKVFCKQS